MEAVSGRVSFRVDPIFFLFLDLIVIITIIMTINIITINNVIIISRLSMAALYNHHRAAGLRAHPVELS